MAFYEDTAIAQFENTNSLRAYPFVEGCSLCDRDGKELSRDVVVDVHLFVPAVGDVPSNPDVYLDSVHLSQAMVSVCFKSGFGGVTNALSVTVARENFEPYRPYRLQKLAGVEDMGGIVTFGDIEFPGFPETYFLDGASVHPCCVAVAKPAELRSIVDERSGESLRGNVKIDFSDHILSERNGKDFRLYLEDGSYEELASECVQVTGLDACGATPINSINGVRPDRDGNIVLWFH